VVFLIEPVRTVSQAHHSRLGAFFLWAHFEFPDAIGESQIAFAGTRAARRIGFGVTVRRESGGVSGSRWQIEVAFFALDLVRIQINLTEPKVADFSVCKLVVAAIVDLTTLIDFIHGFSIAAFSAPASVAVVG